MSNGRDLLLFKRSLYIREESSGLCKICHKRQISVLVKNILK